MRDASNNRSELVVEDGRVYHLGLAPEEVAPYIFLVGDPQRAFRVAAHFDEVELEVARREYVTLTGHARGRRVTVVGTGIGTDNVEIALIELHALLNVDLASGLPRDSQRAIDFLRIGTSGGVAPEVRPGALCVAEYALGLDSTGLYYDVPAADLLLEEIERRATESLHEGIASTSRFAGRLPVYASKADEGLHASLLRSAERHGEIAASGITVSSSGFYGPSGRRVSGLEASVGDLKRRLGELTIRGRRVVNMEMESSLLFHLARALGHRAATICPSISAASSADDLVDYAERIEIAIAIALDALLADDS